MHKENALAIAQAACFGSLIKLGFGVRFVDL